MTTNCLLDLDTAMVRPGRVDVVELFDKATRETAKNMFTRMCSSGTTAVKEVRHHASRFAEHIEDGRFSTAELQGFLQQRRDPEKACAEVAEWVEAENVKLKGVPVEEVTAATGS
ncbi:hypothetical protein VE03_10463 [Pseudogymnoascus sp. 23342-1-I1]|nr:hypothetical protein VE03_10463 [Pseudogymnoascus sp. 23342-1-I1]